MAATAEMTVYARPPERGGNVVTTTDGRNKRPTIGRTTRRTTPIPVSPPRIPTPMPPKSPKESAPKLKIAKYEKTYQSSLAAHLLLFTTNREKDIRLVHKQQQQQQQQQPSTVAAASCRRVVHDEEGEDRRRRDGGGRSSSSSAANPERSARNWTRGTDDDSHATAEDELRHARRCRLPLPITTTTTTKIGRDDADATQLFDYRTRRYGMYATTATDARYGLRYGLSSSGLAARDPKTSSAAAAFFLRTNEQKPTTRQTPARDQVENDMKLVDGNATIESAPDMEEYGDAYTSGNAGPRWTVKLSKKKKTF